MAANQATREHTAASSDGRRILWICLGLYAFGGALTAFALTRDSQPARCGDGLVAMGARCCGVGQQHELGRCTGTATRCPAHLELDGDGCAPTDATPVDVPGGAIELGAGDWEGEGTALPTTWTVEDFRLDRYEVTERRYLACVDAGACATIALSGEPGRAVSNVTYDEAQTYCAFAGGALPTPLQHAFASAGPENRRYPWGDTGAVCRRAAYALEAGPCGYDAQGPDLVGSRVTGNTPSGIADLAGNVAEWTLAPQDATTASVRGGSYADRTAAALRFWNDRIVDKAAREATVGFRCAYR